MTDNTYVWDLFIRVFHWSLVVLFTVCYLTGEEESSLHIYSGYLILGLLLARIVWGFVGSPHARFSDFIYTPTEAVNYLKGLFAGGLLSRTPDTYRGHNPAGAMMIFALLASLMATGLSGLVVYGLEGEGPLATSMASIVDKQVEDLWEEIHEFMANFSVALIALHISGVILSSIAHRQNLVKAMFTGYKKE